MNRKQPFPPNEPFKRFNADDDRKAADAGDRSRATRHWHWIVRAIISFFLVTHFSLLGLNFASNNSKLRSELADQTLVAFQPYLISMGWYTELAPVSLVTGEQFDRAMRIEYKTSKRDTNWTTWVDSKRSDGRWRRLVALAGALTDHDDSDGLGLIAHTLVTRAAKEGIAIDRIRFSMTLPELGEEPEAIYEASVVQLEPGEVTLVPQIEDTRSVPPVLSTKGQGT